MTLHRFYYPHSFKEGTSCTVRDAGIVEQLRKVLRAKPGFIATLFDGAGREHHAELESYGKNEAVFTIGAAINRDTELKQSISVYQAIPNKISKFEDVLKRGTELGVRHFVPMTTQRVQSPFLRKEDRLRKIVQEACEQCEGMIMPSLETVVSFSDILQTPPAGTNILLYARADASFDAQELAGDTEVNIFVGPEGGFTQEEVIAAELAGFLIVKLGNRIFRTETAALVMISQFI